MSRGTSGQSSGGRRLAAAFGRAVDRGSASVLVLAATGVLLAAGVAALILGSVAVAGQRARLAADLSAIAGATRQRAADVQACAAAAAVARANGARLEGCSLRDADVTVVVSIEVPVWPDPARARSRAGPARPG
ncbi:Rv3654c family TadE-like protein [Intrasporangium sp. YIM S08009]|uniref:Rv3654c family TadE-like protein n=1 Tax=Intrasporangium zincisolvens TaxID=3080018 RepID=UPI002B055410|nr:Rv3654c family TadE-like protein [Intrasporangium sp. YIM S08009]